LHIWILPYKWDGALLEQQSILDFRPNGASLPGAVTIWDANENLKNDDVNTYSRVVPEPAEGTPQATASPK